MVPQTGRRMECPWGAKRGLVIRNTINLLRLGTDFWRRVFFLSLHGLVSFNWNM
jgi:hypothetical protein